MTPAQCRAARALIGVSQGHNLGDKWAPGVVDLLNKALAGMKDGSLKTCPEKCGVAG